MGNTLYNWTTILKMARFFLNIQLTTMKTKKLLFITLTLLCFSFVANAQRGVRIGYIDMEYILENIPEYKEASTQLNGKVQRWKKDIEKKNDQVELLKINLSTERVLLTTELIEEREEDIKVLEGEMIKYQQDRFGPNGDLFLQRQQLVQPIQDQVFNIVQEIAENKKYDFIFDKSADVVMLYSADRYDISEQVLRTINRASKRTQAETKKERKEAEKETALKLYIQYSFPKDAEQRLSDFENAIMAYQRQLKENIAEKAQEEASAAQNANNEAYDNLISEADALKKADSREAAVEKYKEAIKIKDETYPKDQVAFLTKQIEKKILLNNTCLQQFRVIDTNCRYCFISIRI